jgi:hypothetical protein
MCVRVCVVFVVCSLCVGCACVRVVVKGVGERPAPQPGRGQRGMVGPVLCTVPESNDHIASNVGISVSC